MSCNEFAEFPQFKSTKNPGQLGIYAEHHIDCPFTIEFEPLALAVNEFAFNADEPDDVGTHTTLPVLGIELTVVTTHPLFPVVFMLFALAALADAITNTVTAISKTNIIPLFLNI